MNYMAEYVITRAVDDKITGGTNQPTKEATIDLVEASVIMEKENHYWE